jgi:hypothetical protein
VAHEHGVRDGNRVVQQIHDHDGASQAALLTHFASHPPRRALLLRVTAHRVPVMAQGPRHSHETLRQRQHRGRVHIRVHERLHQVIADRHRTPLHNNETHSVSTKFNSDAALEGPGDGFHLEVGAECHDSADNKSLEVTPANLNLVTLYFFTYSKHTREENLHNHQKGASDGSPSYCNCKYQVLGVIM